MAKETILTKEGKEKLEYELEERLTKTRQEIAERLKAAIALGDLSENSEYDEAKNAQAFNEGKILELQSMLRNAKVIEESADGPKDENVVALGRIVKLEDMETGDQEEYTVVGTQEADPLADPPRISNESPVGKATLGKKVGTTVKITTPAGEFDYKIIDISRPNSKKKANKE